MKISPLLSQEGRPLFIAGGNESWKQFSFREWVVSLEWIGNGRKVDRFMVIWPQSNILTTPGAVKPGMWAIGARAVVDFVGFDAQNKCTGLPSQHCISEALEALPILGRDKNDKQAHLSLIDAVVRFAPDLVLMPSAPPKVKQDMADPAMWDVKTINKHTGQVMTEVEV